MDTRCVDVGDGGSDAIDPRDMNHVEVVGLRIDPPSATLASVDGSMPTQLFSAILERSDGSEIPAEGAIFTLSDRAIGTIGEISGEFVANGLTAGTRTITVTHTGGTASAEISVTIERTYIAEGLPPEIATTFEGAPVAADPSRAAGLVYPLDGVVFPQNVYPADVQWNVAEVGDIFRVELRNAAVSITAFVSHLPSAPYPDEHWLVDEVAWRAIAQSAGSTTLSVDRLQASTGERIDGREITLNFVPVAVAGSVYYWDIVPGRIRRINDGEGSYEDFMPTPPPGTDGASCVGCHSVSRSGRYMAGRLGGGDNVGTIFDLTTDLTGNPPPSSWNAVTQGAYWWFSSWNPDDTRIVVARDGGNPYLDLLDPATGTFLLDPAAPKFHGTYPDWSPDGTRVAYVSGQSSWGDNAVNGNLTVIGITGDAFGMPTVIHSDPLYGPSDSFPSWAPDSSAIAFANGTGSRSESQFGALYLIDPDGSNIRELTAALSGDGKDFQPRFSPFHVGGYYWLSFLSRRPYGNQTQGNLTSAENLRQQIWVTAIRDDAAPGTDPSSVPYWLPGQDAHSANISAYWAPRACRVDGESCDVGSDCCGGECIPGAEGALVCSPPPPERCRTIGETCSTDADCCEGSCANHVCGYIIE